MDSSSINKGKKAKRMDNNIYDVIATYIKESLQQEEH